jgi:hypothetical protein
MQKVVAILEQYVEFIVLGIGAIFLVFMAWTYLAKTPVEVSVGGQEMRPGEIDAATVKGPLDLLERSMANSHPPKVAVPNFTEVFIRSLNTPEPEPFVAVNWNANGADVRPIVPEKFQNPLDQQQVVKALPKLPPAEIADVNHGRSNVVMPPADWVPGTPLPPVNVQALIAPPPGTPGAVGTTGFGGRPALPGQPAPLINQRPGVAGAPAQPAQPAVVIPGQPAPPAPPTLADKDWVTVMYKLPMQAIGKAFSDVNIPQMQNLNLFKTCILDVELVRQEIVDGKPAGDESAVKKLEISGIPPFPNGLAEELQYIGWASANPGQIIQPGFFQVARGDPWFPPGVQETMLAQQLPVNNAFDPSKPYTPAELRALTPDQFKAVKAYREQQAAQRKAANRAKYGGKGGTTPGPADMGGMEEPPPQGIADVGRALFAQVLPPDMMETPEEGMEGDQGAMGVPGVPQAPAVFAQFPLPPGGEFDPRMAPEPTIGWAHDDTAEPGHTYRYKVRYKVKNPVFQVLNVAQPKNLAEVFALVSPDSNWSQPISIPPLTRFFVASLFNNKVSLEIFRWQNGQLHSTKVNVSPGDLITAKTPDGIDYSTGWTLVDITTDPRDNRSVIIVADPSGNLGRRDFQSDNNDPEYQKMRSLLTPAVAAR